MMRRRNPHGRGALLAAELRARAVIAGRRAGERAASAAADVDDRRARIERAQDRAQERAALLEHLRGPRLLARNVPARLEALLAGTNDNDSDYERWF